MDFWDQFYTQFGIKDFIYFISSPQLQDLLFPVKLVFVAFSLFFLGAIYYYMTNSSWLQFKFLQDTTEFFAWQAYGLKQIAKRWKRITKRTESGLEADYKLAIIEADDFLNDILEERGYEGKGFEGNLQKAARLLGDSINDILGAHQIRDSIVYNPDYKIDVDTAKKILSVYENAINAIGVS